MGKRSLSDYNVNEIIDHIDELCKNSVAKGCFQDYHLLTLILREFNSIVKKGV